MSEDTRDALLARLMSDGVFRNAVVMAASVEDVRKIIGDAGFCIAPEDVVSGRSSGELTDAELEGAAGGGFITYGCNTPTQYFVFTHCYP